MNDDSPLTAGSSLSAVNELTRMPDMRMPRDEDLREQAEKLKHGLVCELCGVFYDEDSETWSHCPRCGDELVEVEKA